MRPNVVHLPFVSIILPTFCEEENIVPLIRAISSVLQKEKKSFEILIVDDNSPDKTQQHVLEYAKKHKEVRLLVRKKNPSLGLSIGLGVKEAVGTVVIGMDADFNHDPKTIPLLLTKLEHGYDLAVASRFVRGGGMEDKIRFFPTLFFNMFFRCLGFPVLDATSGFYAIYRNHLKKMGIDSIYYGYGDYHLRLMYAAKRLGLRICEVPTFYALRRFGSSKSRLLKMAVSYVTEALKISTQRASMNIENLFELRLPSRKDESLYDAFVQEMMSNDHRIKPSALKMNKMEKTYADWVMRIHNNDQGKDIVHGWVPSTLLFFFRKDLKKILGVVDIRHTANEKILQFYGHIGYGVAPSERQKGYATAMLYMALQYCRSIGLRHVLLTCDKENTASAKTILKNGGILENSVLNPDGKITQRYWIHI